MASIISSATEALAQGRKYHAMHLGSTKDYQIQLTQWYEIVIGGLDTTLTFLVQSCTLPEISNPVVEVGYGNTTAKIAGKREFGSGSIVFMDAIIKDTEAQLLRWQDQVQDHTTGKQGWTTDYKKMVTITEYGPDGTHERTWTLEGCWPSSITYGEMSGESADKKTITVTLEYDNAYRNDY